MSGIRLRTLIFLGVLGCATEPAADLSGSWMLSESVTSSSGFTCQTTGDLLIAHFRDNNRFTGQRARTGTCAGAPAGFSLDGAQTLLNAEIKGTDVKYEVDFCDYEGVLVGNNEITGTFSCPPLSQQTFSLSGTWTASR